MYTFVGAAFTHYLHYIHSKKPHDFLFDPDKLPPKSVNNLRYNKELFADQMNWLWRFTLVFAAVSMLMVGCGLMISSNSD